MVRFDLEQKAGVSNLLTLMHGATGRIVELSSTLPARCMAISRARPPRLSALLEPVQQRYQALRADEAHLLAVLSRGADEGLSRGNAAKVCCRGVCPQSLTIVDSR